MTQGILDFDGPGLTAEDDRRLSNQLMNIYDLMKDGQWRSLGDIEAITTYPQPSISAQLRHLRKERFGSHKVDRRYIGDGLYLYRVTA